MAIEVEKEELSIAAAELSKALPDVVVADSVVPEAYVWPKEELAHVGHDEYAGDDEIPVIDLGGLNGDLDETRRREICDRIRVALGSWGFFQVVNHGVDLALVERVQAISKKFFELPLETKELIDCTFEEDRLLGYGFLVANKDRTSRRSWSEGLFMDSPHVALYSSTFWPEDHDIQTEFSEAMEEYIKAVGEFAIRLFRLILGSLGVDYPVTESERFLPKEPALIRLNHYPPCPDPSLASGLVPHYDGNLITILHQGDVGGLQVMKDDQWHAVRPHPGAFAINGGNMLQAISNNLCKSALHRAVVNKDEDRYSLAYFVQAPNSNGDQVAPLPELVDAEHPAKYHPFTWKEYIASQVVNIASQQIISHNALEYFEVK
ncbi:hypothetical protein KC19_2G214700 [Ceratodon purpureus]|uniref:Fe2OG dioxygenase domain-containing protein n=1 Tax=Ceratodon purpureus TaxID=3225 RepID=A0A8T0IYL5_CERPU|nr:hypothetical protein KC19_2G214700 [Ceratodon purpureus]